MERYYSPQLQRDLISPLYHAAKARKVPMTALASRFVAEGLERLGALHQQPAHPVNAAAVPQPAGRR